MSNFEGKVFVKISELNATTTFDTNDEFVLVRNGTTVKTAGIDFVDTVVSIGNLATKSYTDAAVAALVAGAPGALNTLNELSAALNNDANFASTITNQLSLKLNVSNFGLYFWNELNAITTYHIAEGTNLYYTEERVNANFATKNTDALAEGTSNLYYTDTRVLDVMAPLLFTGPDLATNNAIVRFDSTTGSLVQNSLVTISDTGAIVAPQVGSIIPFYFANQTAFPSAGTYHGAVAHSHSDGKMYFAHGGVWNALANASELFSGDYNDLNNLPTMPTFTTVTTTNLNVQNVTFTGTGAVTFTSSNDLNFVAAGSILANGSSVITKAQLKAVVAASTDFADFKVRIAAL